MSAPRFIPHRNVLARYWTTTLPDMAPRCASHWYVNVPALAKVRAKDPSFWSAELGPPLANVTLWDVHAWPP